MFSFLMENRERESESAYELRAQKLHQQLVTAMASEGTQSKASSPTSTTLLICSPAMALARGLTTMQP
jgi:hypothetical protein